MRRIVVALSMVLALQAHAQPPQMVPEAPQTFMFDMPKQFPTAFRLWQQSVPRALSLPDWLSKFDGVSSPIHDVTIAGQAMKFGTVCMPHDCGDNLAGVMFTPQQDRVVAVVHMAGENQVQSLMVIGTMSGPEFACIQRLMQVGATTC